EDLPDRGRERRPTDLFANLHQFFEHLVEPVSGGVRAQMRVERGDEPGWKTMLRRAHRNPRSERGDRLIADVLVDEIGSAPERVDIDARVQPEAPERRCNRLARDA